MEPFIWCVSRQLSCRAEACVADWQKAQRIKPAPWESRWHCRGCTDGAARAGVSAERALQAQQLDRLLHYCVRCHSPAERIVKGFCLSCYNRERELITGKNRKGTFPVLLHARYPVRAWQLRFRNATVPSGSWQWPAHRAADALEAMLTLIRQQRTLLLFARPVGSGPRQLSLWGGL